MSGSFGEVLEEGGKKTMKLIDYFRSRIWRFFFCRSAPGPLNYLISSAQAFTISILKIFDVIEKSNSSTRLFLFPIYV